MLCALQAAQLSFKKHLRTNDDQYTLMKYLRALVFTLTLPSEVAGFTTDSGKLSNP